MTSTEFLALYAYVADSKDMNLKKIVPTLNASLVKHLPEMKGVAFNQVLQAFEKLQKKGWMKIHYNSTLYKIIGGDDSQLLRIQ